MGRTKVSKEDRQSVMVLELVSHNCSEELKLTSGMAVRRFGQ